MANLPPFVIAAFTEKKVQPPMSDASRSATQTLNEAPDPASHFLRFALGPASLSGSGASCDGVRAISSKGALDSSRPFHSAYPFRFGMRVSGSCWVSIASPSQPQEWRGLRAGPPGRGADGLFSLAAGPVGWVSTGSLSQRESQPGGLYIPRQQTVTFTSAGVPLPETREEASASRRSARRTRPRKAVQTNCSLLATMGACFHRNGGPVTTILSREGRSPRMTFRMCGISSRRGAMARRPGHPATQPDAAPLLRADRSASSDSREKLDARLADKGRAVE
jgi:hypothetical protein